MKEVAGAKHGWTWCLLLFVTILLAMSGCRGKDPVVIQEIGWSFDLPADFEWIPVETLPDGSRLYRFKHKGIEDGDNLVVHPNIAFIVVDVPKQTDVVGFALERKRYDVVGHFDPPEWMPCDEAVGQIAEYVAPFDGQTYKHRILVLHHVRNGLGVEVVCDATEAVFEKVQKGFIDALSSIRAIDLNAAGGR